MSFMVVITPQDVAALSNAYAPALSAGYRFEGDKMTMTLKAPTKVGKVPVELQFGVEAVGGGLKLTTLSAKAVGLGLFGTVRKIARETILGMLAPYHDLVFSTDTADANIVLIIEHLRIVGASIRPFGLVLNVELR